MRSPRSGTGWKSGDSCPVTEPAASIGRDLDAAWFENTKGYQAGSVMGEEKRCDQTFRFRSVAL